MRASGSEFLVYWDNKLEIVPQFPCPALSSEIPANPAMIVVRPEGLVRDLEIKLSVKGDLMRYQCYRARQVRKQEAGLMSIRAE